MREEYFLDKHIMDRIVENHFDSSHNTFESIRRTADIWEWGNTVLWPGLFGDLGPCNGYVGTHLPGEAKTCVDEAWPDGEGSFHTEQATPLGIADLVERMDQVDWTEGLVIRQGRVGPQECANTKQLGASCLGEIGLGDGNTASFGYNWTHPGAAPAVPFVHMDVDQLGANPLGVISASIPSQKVYDAEGFVAVVIPFFSEEFLPEQSGPAADVTDYRLTYVNTTNDKSPNFYCVRLSPNGLHVRQLCDPGTGGNGTGAMTGAVRLAVEQMWNDLKRGHFIDSRTRVLTITLQLKSNAIGIRYRMTLMFEMYSLGAVMTSYDVETRPLDAQLESSMITYASIALGMVIFFCILEGVEVVNAGLAAYFSDVWNVMDWLNFIVYFFVYINIQRVYSAIAETPANAPCTSYMCTEVGYFDDWKVMGAFRDSKIVLSLCVCIQLLKILKFLAMLVPKMGLATAVLKTCVIDLMFFGVSFIISMLAFSMMLFVQLGPMMEDYLDQIPAFIALFRALFGDFDIDEILDNSSGYLNAILFLGYLFIAIFIMLSMFLAILAEAQVSVRDQEAEWRKQRESGDFEGWPDEYGAVSAFGRQVKRLAVPVLAFLPTASAPADAEKPVGDADDRLEMAASGRGGGPASAEEPVFPDEAPPRAPTVAEQHAISATQMKQMLAAQEAMMHELLALRSEVAALRDKQPPIVTVALANGVAGVPAGPAGATPGLSRFPQAPYPPPPPPPYPPPAREARPVLSGGSAQPVRYGV